MGKLRRTINNSGLGKRINNSKFGKWFEQSDFAIACEVLMSPHYIRSTSSSVVDRFVGGLVKDLVCTVLSPILVPMLYVQIKCMKHDNPVFYDALEMSYERMKSTRVYS